MTTISDYPKKLNSAAKSLKSLVFIVTCLVVALTFVIGWRYYDKGEVDQKIDSLKKSMYWETADIQTHVKENSTEIKGVKVTVGQIQTIQHKTFARDEAKRLTSEIRNSAGRLKKYDWLVDRNMRRLKDGLDPCTTLRCH